MVTSQVKPIRVKVSEILNTSADQAWKAVKDPKVLLLVSQGMLGFSDADRLPQQWRESDSFQTRLRFFHLFPGWIHEMRIERLDDRRRELWTDERGGPIKVWRHRIGVEPISESQCRYTDEVAFQAGFLSPLVWLWAQVFYRYRLMRARAIKA